MDDMIGRLNSATKYPPIETYHPLDPSNGKLREFESMTEGPSATGTFVLTEKVNGTNGRIVVMPDGDWFIGSREELLYAHGDRVVNPNLGIVPALLPVGPRMVPAFSDDVTVYFFEVYGYRIGPAAKQYTRDAQAVGYRLFDVAAVELAVLNMTRSSVASWRDHGGQRFMSEETLVQLAEVNAVRLVPRIATVSAAELPTGLEGMQRFIQEYLPETGVALDDSAGKKPEGIVLRSADRSYTAKARFEDYERTLRGTALHARSSKSGS